MVCIDTIYKLTLLAFGKTGAHNSVRVLVGNTHYQHAAAFIAKGNHITQHAMAPVLGRPVFTAAVVEIIPGCLELYPVFGFAELQECV